MRTVKRTSPNQQGKGASFLASREYDTPEIRANAERQLDARAKDAAEMRAYRVRTELARLGQKTYSHV